MIRNIYIFLLLVVFASCRTPIYMTQEMTDTLVVMRHDTIERVVKERESVVTRDSTNVKVILASNGIDTLRYYEIHYIENTSNRATIDSLRRAIDNMKVEASVRNENKEIIKEVARPKKWWEPYLIASGALFNIAVLLTLLCIIYTRTRAKNALIWLINHIRK